jgi:hypothetical protein
MPEPGAKKRETKSNSGREESLAYARSVVRLDASGNKLWENSFGGTGDEEVNAITATADGGCIVSGWSSSGVSGNTINNLTFSSVTGNYITLSGGALNNNTINATGATFGGLTGATATIAQNFDIEDKIAHATDAAGLGFVRVKAGEVFVTPNSGSIQRGVDAAVDFDVGTPITSSPSLTRSPRVWINQREVVPDPRPIFIPFFYKRADEKLR